MKYNAKMISFVNCDCKMSGDGIGPSFRSSTYRQISGGIGGGNSSGFESYPNKKLYDEITKIKQQNRELKEQLDEVLSLLRKRVDSGHISCIR